VTGKNPTIIIYKTFSKFKATVNTFSFPQVTGHHRVVSGDIAYMRHMQRIALCIRMQRIALCIRMQTRMAVVAVNMIRYTENTCVCSLHYYRFNDITRYTKVYF
jgi:hypothetical protein